MFYLKYGFSEENPATLRQPRAGQPAKVKGFSGDMQVTLVMLVLCHPPFFLLFF
jgi:hypothetical protein